jgi:hypothetical protein
MPNKLGQAVIFSAAGITTTAVSGSVTDFTYKREFELKEVTDGANQFLGVAKSKNKEVVNMDIVLTTSGSNVVANNGLDAISVTNPYSTSGSGTFNISAAPSLQWKNDDFAKYSVEATRWLDANGNALS